MAYRLILDENVEHVDFVPELGKGTADHPIAEYSLDTDRVIVTYDDDFVLEVDEGLYRAVLGLVQMLVITTFTAAIRKR